MGVLIYEARDGVGRLSLNRPGKLNAQTPAMWEELRELGGRLLEEGELRCLVVAGEGRSFSAGIDLAELGGGAAQLGGAGERGLLERISAWQEAFTWLYRAPFATIARVQGHALGAGLQLALACDLRVVARGTQLGMIELRYGILPDLGGTYWLPRLVGEAKAKELILSAATVDADEALRIGMVNRVVEPTELAAEVDRLAATLAAQPPVAVRAAKRAIEAGAGLALDEARRVAALGQRECLRSEDFVEAAAARMERRDPRYRGR